NISWKRSLSPGPVLGLFVLLAVLFAITQLNRSALIVQAEPSDKAPKVVGTHDFPIVNPIDQFILQRLQAEKVQPSPVATDEEFCRRVYLDVIGCIPTRSELKLFLSDRAVDKRA